jgi:hypothetical protein
VPLLPNGLSGSVESVRGEPLAQDPNCDAGYGIKETQKGLLTAVSVVKRGPRWCSEDLCLQRKLSIRPHGPFSLPEEPRIPACTHGRE